MCPPSHSQWGKELGLKLGQPDPSQFFIGQCNMFLIQRGRPTWCFNFPFSEIFSEIAALFFRRRLKQNSKQYHQKQLPHLLRTQCYWFGGCVPRGLCCESSRAMASLKCASGQLCSCPRSDSVNKHTYTKHLVDTRQWGCNAESHTTPVLKGLAV